LLLPFGSDAVIAEPWHGFRKFPYMELRHTAMIGHIDPTPSTKPLDESSTRISADETISPKVMFVTLRVEEVAVTLVIPRGTVACLSVKSQTARVMNAIKLFCRGGSPHVDPSGLLVPPPLPTGIKPNRHLPPPLGGLAPGAMRRIRQHVEERISDKISLHDMAAVSGLSASHFGRAFKQSMGMTPHRYLSERRVRRAAQLIQETPRPLSEVCLAVGCSDQSHFTRLFAQFMGETPGEFRHRHR
jgi:AraC-like DNA-binding protein